MHDPTGITEEQCLPGGSAPVRCLIVAPAPLSDDWVGGISNFIRGFIAQAPDDFDIAVCGVGGADDGPLGRWRTMQVSGRSIKFMPATTLRSGRRLLPVKARLVYGLLRHRRDIATSGRVLQIHAPGLDLPFARRSTAVIRVVHNDPANLASSRTGTLWRHFGWALRRIEDGSYRRADRVYFVDAATYDRYDPSHEDGCHMFHLPNGVDTTLFRPSSTEERDMLRVELGNTTGVSPSVPWILFCGRLDRQKDPDLLIASFAAARLLPSLRDAQLLIVGAGPLDGATRLAAEAAGVARAAHFVGTIEHHQLPKLMSAADALILTSAYEGTPFVVLEALASGLPVVSTSVGDVPRLVRHRVTGWLTTSRSATDLAEGLVWAVKQPREAIGPLCAASISQFSLARLLAPFYEEHRVLAGRMRPTSSAGRSDDIAPTTPEHSS